MSRIEAGIRAFAAGDALGAPWEGEPRAALADADLLPIPQREDWPIGSTSDDTAQLLLLAETLAEGPDPAATFLRLLANAVSEIRGIGPSSAAAIERYLSDGSLVATSGDTNGALMRAPVLGWAAQHPSDRRELVEATTRTTHGGRRALACAQVIAALADAALDDPPLPSAVDHTLAEAGELGAALRAWEPRGEGVSMDSVDTAGAVLWLVRTGGSPAELAERAVRLGGDTDTVAAIAAGIAAAHPHHADATIPWLDQVLLPSPDQIKRVARALAGRRHAGR